MLSMRRLLVALLIVSAPLAAQTFPTITPLPAALADGSGCSPGNSVNCFVPVSGVAVATSLSLNFTFAPAHTFYSDVRCFISKPSGAAVLVLAAGCEGSLTDGSDLGGPYTVTDGAPSFDGAAAAAGSFAVIPAGTYGPDDVMNVLLTSCGNLNGNWIVTFQDMIAADVGSIAACSLTFGVGSGAFSICQAGPGQPLNLTHAGTPGTIYFNPAVANTPTALLNGWFLGLDIPFPTLVNEIAMAPPLGNLFHGTIGASGTSVFVVPGVPAGWTIQIVGAHFDGTTGDLIYSSPAINYTVQ